MRGYASESSFKLAKQGRYRAVSNLSLILDESSLLDYKNLFGMWMSENTKKLSLSLRRSAMLPEDFC